MTDKTPASRKLVNLSKAMWSDAERECDRLRLVNATLVSALRLFVNECNADHQYSAFVKQGKRAIAEAEKLT